MLPWAPQLQQGPLRLSLSLRTHHPPPTTHTPARCNAAEEQGTCNGWVPLLRLHQKPYLGATSTVNRWSSDE